MGLKKYVSGVALRYLLLSFLISRVWNLRTSPLALYSACNLAWLWFCMQFNVPFPGLVLGKDPASGQVQVWSFIVHWPFHLSNALYAALMKGVSDRTPASEIQPNLWLGGSYSEQAQDLAGFSLTDTWLAVVDLTCETSETARVDSGGYLNIPLWDGNPPSPAQLSMAASFVKDKLQQQPTGKVLVHCQHGVGRSTAVMCAILVECGIAPTVVEAFKICKSKRSFVKLNESMQQSLKSWEQARS